MAGFRIGEVARLCGVPVRRLDGWVRRGYLRATNVGLGPGAYKRVSEAETHVAVRAARLLRKYGLSASRELFQRVRAKGDEHGGERESDDQRDDHRAAGGH